MRKSSHLFLGAEKDPLLNLNTAKTLGPHDPVFSPFRADDGSCRCSAGLSSRPRHSRGPRYGPRGSVTCSPRGLVRARASTPLRTTPAAPSSAMLGRSANCSRFGARSETAIVLKSTNCTPRHQPASPCSGDRVHPVIFVASLAQCRSPVQRGASGCPLSAGELIRLCGLQPQP